MNSIAKVKNILKRAKNKLETDYDSIKVHPRILISYDETIEIIISLKSYVIDFETRLTISLDDIELEKSDSALYKLIVEKFSYEIEEYLLTEVI